MIVWDENDYSGSPAQSSGLFPPPNQNKVVLTVETNHDGQRGVQSGNYYNSYSLLKSIEAGFGLPCLNHAYDSNVAVMSDLRPIEAVAGDSWAGGSRLQPDSTPNG